MNVCNSNSIRNLAFACALLSVRYIPSSYSTCDYRMKFNFDLLSQFCRFWSVVLLIYCQVTSSAMMISGKAFKLAVDRFNANISYNGLTMSNPSDVSTFQLLVSTSNLSCHGTPLCCPFDTKFRCRPFETSSIFNTPVVAVWPFADFSFVFRWKVALCLRCIILQT